MAYSRWSYSVWYTFWTSMASPEITFKLPTKKLKDAQSFEICDYPSYTISYGELKSKGLRRIIKEVESFYKDKKITTFSDYTELRWYLIQFMDDIDEHFKWHNFFLHEWYYPIRNSIKWKIKDWVIKFNGQ
jgi:hypothetical protein